MEQHEETINEIGEIERVLEAFMRSVECVPRGICIPDNARVDISKYYVGFVSPHGIIRLERDGKSIFVTVEAGGCRLITTSYDMFMYRDDKKKVYSPRIAVGSNVYTVDEFVAFMRRGFQVLLSAASWV
jgi:hypothetical protein